jgi:SAM-dependent methyltransferase
MTARNAFSYFRKKDIRGLRKYLCGTEKFRFVINSIGYNDARKILEIGCSKGYLTSYFILGGYEILGVDVSETAVRSATGRFGPHFVVAENVDLKSLAPFDAIYHVGTVGCVDDPIQFTRNLISLLRPSGVLLFNFPNIASCQEMGEMWLAGATPPDAVTLFPEWFWKDRFQDTVEVRVSAEPTDGHENMIKFAHKVLKRPYLHAGNRSLLQFHQGLNSSASEKSLASLISQNVARLVDKIGFSYIIPNIRRNLVFE